MKDVKILNFLTILIFKTFLAPTSFLHGLKTLQVIVITFASTREKSITTPIVTIIYNYISILTFNIRVFLYISYLIFNLIFMTPVCFIF